MLTVELPEAPSEPGVEGSGNYCGFGKFDGTYYIDLGETQGASALSLLR